MLQWSLEPLSFHTLLNNSLPHHLYGIHLNLAGIQQDSVCWAAAETTGERTRKTITRIVGTMHSQQRANCLICSHVECCSSIRHAGNEVAQHAGKET